MTSDRIPGALFTKTQQAVLGLLFANVERAYHLRGIVRESGIGQGTIQRELQRLTEAGIILREKQGQQVLYRANRNSPVFPELRGLIIKTCGLAQQLGAALAGVEERIQVAFMYGSMVRGDETGSSDIDLLIIGSLTLRDVVKSLGGVQQTLGREINPAVYTPREYRMKMNTGHHFLTALQKEPKIFLIGDEDELRRLG
jgi:predicted nucleotidyltransferase